MSSTSSRALHDTHEPWVHSPLTVDGPFVLIWSAPRCRESATERKDELLLFPTPTWSRRRGSGSRDRYLRPRSLLRATECCVPGVRSGTQLRYPSGRSSSLRSSRVLLFHSWRPSRSICAGLGAWRPTPAPGDGRSRQYRRTPPPVASSRNSRTYSASAMSCVATVCNVGVGPSADGGVAEQCVAGDDPGRPTTRPSVGTRSPPPNRIRSMR